MATVLANDLATATRLAGENLRTASKAVTDDSARRFLRLFEAHLAGPSASMWRTVIGQQIGGTAKRSIERVAGEVGISFNLLNPAVGGWVARRSAFLVTGASETTKAAIRESVRAGLEAGETVEGIAKRIQDDPVFHRARARLIARTETTTAGNAAPREALSAYAAANGAVVTKTWLNSGDDRVRDEHLDAPEGVGGETRPIDEPFSNGLMEPSEPNCRCVLTYEVIRKPEAPAEPTEAERSALMDYTGGGYKEINAALREGAELGPDRAKQVAALDEMIRRRTETAPFELWRGERPRGNWLAGRGAEMAGLSEDARVERTFQLMLAHAERTFPTGSTFKDEAFVSTSESLLPANDAAVDPGGFGRSPNNGWIFKIVDAKGMPVRQITRYDDEFEWLIARETTFEVIGVAEEMLYMFEADRERRSIVITVRMIGGKK